MCQGQGRSPMGQGYGMQRGSPYHKPAYSGMPSPGTPGYGMKPMSMGGMPRTGGTSYNNDPPIQFPGPEIGAGPNGEHIMSKPYPGRDISVSVPSAQPSQPFMPGGWQPSFGGSAPQPFMPQPQTGGLNTFNQAPISAQPQQAQPPQPTGDVVADQRAMDAYNQQQFTKSGAAPQTRAPMPPQPSQMQPGQAGWNWGVNPVAGNVRTDFGQSWQPAFSPGQNEYLNRMTVNQNGVAPWLSQVNWGDAINSVGQLSGTPFNPAMWSR